MNGITYSLLVSLSCLVLWSESQKINSANTKLTAKLIERLSLGQNGNYVISPTSLAIGLGMLYEGLGDSSRAQMEKLLELSSSSLSSDYQDISSLKNSPSLNYGNLIIMDNSSIPKDSYIESIKKNYEASPFVQPFSFSDPQRIETKVNKWVASQTNDKIQNFLASGSVDETTKILLVNVLSFQDDWEKAFSSDLTHNSEFTLTSGSKITIPMMNGDFNQVYAMKQNGLTIVVLNFKNDSSINMAFVLPDEESTLISALKDDLLDTLFDYKNKMKRLNVRLEIPKFKFSSRTELSEHLEALGLRNIFTPAANFSRMAVHYENLLVSSLFQKTEIDVNEMGVSAVAATGIFITTYTLFIPDLEAKFNKPFFVFINKGQNVLFAGQVVNP